MDPDPDPGGPKTCGSGSATLGDSRVHKTTYAPMIYTALCVMFLMRADTLRGEVGPKLHSPIVQFHWGPLPHVMYLPASKK
jgi:hypothetical protein